MPLRIGKKETDNRRGDDVSPVKPFSFTRKCLSAVLPPLSAWIYANRILSEPGAWESSSRQGLAFLMIIGGIALGIFTVRHPGWRRLTPAFVVLLTVTAIRLLFVDVVRIEGPSMEPALHDNEYVVIEKISVGLHMPALDFPLTAFPGSSGSSDAVGPPGTNSPQLWPRGGWRMPRRGELIVFDYWEGTPRGHRFVKRVIAGPGDAFAFDGGKIFVNGSPPMTDRHEPIDPNAETNPHVTPVFTPPPLLKSLDSAFTQSVLYGLGKAGRVPDSGLLVLGDNRKESRDSRVLGFIPVAIVQGRVLFRF